MAIGSTGIAISLLVHRTLRSTHLRAPENAQGSMTEMQLNDMVGLHGPSEASCSASSVLTYGDPLDAQTLVLTHLLTVHWHCFEQFTKVSGLEALKGCDSSRR